MTSRSSLDILETVEADGTTDEMRALVTDETPIRTPLVMSGASYGSTTASIEAESVI